MTPPTDKKLAKMKTMCQSTTPGTVELAEAYKNLPRCIEEIERLRVVVRQHWEEKARPLIEDTEAAEQLDASDFNLRIGYEKCGHRSGVCTECLLAENERLRKMNEALGPLR